MTLCTIMVTWVVEFSSRGYKIRRFLPKNQHIQRKWLNFENWCIIGRWQKEPKFDFQSQFSTSKNLEIFLIFCFIKKYQFRSTFFVIDIFKSLYFLKWCPIFDSSPLHQFSKFNHFLWVCWFLGKNLSNFVSHAWKLDNQYCHTSYVLLSVNKEMESQKKGDNVLPSRIFR